MIYGYVAYGMSVCMCVQYVNVRVRTGAPGITLSLTHTQHNVYTLSYYVTTYIRVLAAHSLIHSRSQK